MILTGLALFKCIQSQRRSQNSRKHLRWRALQSKLKSWETRNYLKWWRALQQKLSAKSCYLLFESSPFLMFVGSPSTPLGQTQTICFHLLATILGWLKKYWKWFMKLLVPFFEASTSLKNFELCRSNWAFFNWDSFPSRLNSHYKAWSYKKKKHEEI